MRKPKVSILRPEVHIFHNEKPHLGRDKTGSPILNRKYHCLTGNNQLLLVEHISEIEKKIRRKRNRKFYSQTGNNRFEPFNKFRKKRKKI